MWRFLTIALVIVGLTPGSAQGPEVSSLMREKLAHTQKILEALVTSNWPVLEMQSRELEGLTNDPRWTVFRYPEYAKYSADFLRAVQALHAAASRRDLEAAPRAYVNVTLRCVDCHRYLARIRVTETQ